MINSEYPLCIKCEFCETRLGVGKKKELTFHTGQTFYDCHNDIVTKIDVVSGNRIISSCETQRKSTGSEKLKAFGIMGADDDEICGLSGKYFKEKA